MNLSKAKCLVSLGIAALFFNTTLPASAQTADVGRIKPAKTKEKNVKRGTIEVKNDTGKDCNDFHIAFKPGIPTIEKVRVGSRDPFPAGYRPRGTSSYTGPAYADFGRQKGDGEVKAGEKIKIEIAWTGEMPEIAYAVWTLDGVVQTAAADAPKQELEIKGKDADAARKAKADAEAKAKAEQEKAAKKEAEEAKKEAKKGIQKSVGGLEERRIETENGTLRILLPNDLRSGDTVSGTVIAEPKGTTVEERRRNEDELSGLVLDAAGQKTPVKDRKFTWTLPAALLTFTLFKEDGTPLRASMGSIPLPKPGPDPDPVGHGDFSIPAGAQTGRPMAISGRFDPAQPTEVTIGGRPAEVLAESPRQTIVEMPRGLVRPQPVSVSDGGALVGTGTASAVNVRLSAEKTTLLRGESTTLRLEVTGLAAYVGDRLEVYFDPAYIVIQNDSPQVIEFFGPGSQPFDGSVLKPKPTLGRAVKITAAMLDEEGKFVRTLMIRSRQAGPFAISAHFCLDGDFDSISRSTAGTPR